MRSLLITLFTPAALAANHFYGIAANNAKGNVGTYTCKSQDDWNNVASQAKSAGLEAIRVYGADCNAYTLASTAAKANGLQVFAGIYQSGTNVASSMAQINADAQTFLAAVNQFGADLYVGLSVTNEINDSGANIINAVNTVRNAVRSKYPGPVSAVHTSYQYTQDKTLCQGDQITANAQAFYDGSTASNNVQNYVSGQLSGLRAACGTSKPIIITEAGWPTRGAPNGPANPSIADAVKADQGYNCAAQQVSIYLFEGEDSLWKSDDWERSYGVFNKGLTFSDLVASC